MYGIKTFTRPLVVDKHALNDKKRKRMLREKKKDFFVHIEKMRQKRDRERERDRERKSKIGRKMRKKRWNEFVA